MQIVNLISLLFILFIPNHLLDYLSLLNLIHFINNFITLYLNLMVLLHEQSQEVKKLFIININIKCKLKLNKSIYPLIDGSFV
jgi:hypothetical protein